MRKTSLPRPAVFVGAALAAAVCFAVVYLFFVTSSVGQFYDERALEGARLGQRTLGEATRRLLDTLPVASVVAAAGIALAIVLIRRNWSVLLVALGAAVAANLITQVLKNSVLARPNLGISGLEHNSFPSGHTTLAASAALVLFLVSSQHARPMVAAIGSLFTVMVGASTVANQWHRPSDVVAALLVVSILGCIAGALLAVRRPRPPVRSGRWWTRGLLLLALPCALVAAFVFLTPILATTSLATESLAAPLAFVGGVAGIAAIGFLLAAAGTRVFRSFA